MGHNPSKELRWAKMIRGYTVKANEAVPVYEFQQVRVLASAEGYSMVRKPKCTPFVLENGRLMPDNFYPPAI